MHDYTLGIVVDFGPPARVQTIWRSHNPLSTIEEHEGEGMDILFHR